MSLPNRSVGVTIVVACKNEARNLEKCLSSLKPARRIVVVDSGSTDGSVGIAERNGAEVIQFAYNGGYPKKRQWALEKIVRTSKWVALLDADEMVSELLWQEICEAVSIDTDVCAFIAVKDFHFLGKRFRFGGFSHSAVFLLRWGYGCFEELADVECGLDMEVHERVLVQGKIARFRNRLIHDDWKGLQAYLDRHNRYSTWEAGVRAGYLKNGVWSEAIQVPRLTGVQLWRRRAKSLLSRLPFEPAIWFVYHYLVCVGFLEGRRGFEASRIRASYIADVRAKMYEASLCLVGDGATRRLSR